MTGTSPCDQQGELAYNQRGRSSSQVHLLLPVLGVRIDLAGEGVFPSRGGPQDD